MRRLARTVSALETHGSSRGSRRRVMGEVVDDGHALRDAANLLPPLDAPGTPRRARDGGQLDAQARHARRRRRRQGSSRL